MTDRNSTWPSDPTTRALLHQIASLGFVVSVHHLPSSLLGTVPASVEMHAVNAGVDPVDQHVARVSLEEGDAEYRCACLLAESVGIDLEG